MPLSGATADDRSPGDRSTPRLPTGAPRPSQPPVAAAGPAGAGHPGEEPERPWLEWRPAEGEHHLRSALWVAGLVAWEWHIPSGRVRVSGGLGTVFGLDGTSPSCLYPSHLARLQPEDWTRVAHAERRALSIGGAYEVEFRVAAPDGTTHWLAERGQVVDRDPSGRATRVVGVVKDITERKAREASPEPQPTAQPDGEAPPTAVATQGTPPAEDPDPLAALATRFRNALLGHAARTGRPEFVDPARLAAMPDAELVVVRGLGRMGVARLRQALGLPPQPCPACAGSGLLRAPTTPPPPQPPDRP